MKSAYNLVPCLVVAMLVAACSSTNVSNIDKYKGRDKLPRPGNIWVYDLAVTSADVRADSAFAGQYAEHPTPQTAEEVAAGRQAAAQLSTQLVEDIRAMGLPAQRASSGTRPQVNDIVLRGTLLAIDEGSAAKRVAIGFGSGASEMKAAIEGFQMTDKGLRRLGSGTVQSGGNKSPSALMAVAGAAATGNPVGLVVSSGMKVYGEASGSSKVEGRAKEAANEIAAQLKSRFEQQGWIQ
ncbi:MAG: DUF4410 domain-containing protein [Candidatus Binatia bacterium]